MAIPLVKWKYWTHRSNCSRKKVSPLTFDEYLLKLEDAGIRAEDVGATKGKYQLSRYTDSGDYTPESCRFITKEQNYSEEIKNGGIENGAEKKRGRTKHNHSGIAEMAEKKSKEFSIRSPKGDIVSGKNLFQFCKDNGLNQGNVWCVIKGLKHSCKGWIRP